MSYPLQAHLPQQAGTHERASAPVTLQEALRSDDFCRKLLENARWPNGPVCTNCGTEGRASRLTTRPGLWTCRACRRCQFSVTSGTPLHRTRLPLSYWVRLFNMMQVGGVSLSISQVSRRFDVAHLTAENMLKRIGEMQAEMPEMSARLGELLREFPRDAGAVRQNVV